MAGRAGDQTPNGQEGNAEQRETVCTYTASGIPTTKTQGLRDVLEIGRLGVVDRNASGDRVAITVKARDGLGLRALRRIAGCRRRVTGGARGLLLGVGTALGWTAHDEEVYWMSVTPNKRVSCSSMQLCGDEGGTYLASTPIERLVRRRGGDGKLRVSGWVSASSKKAE
jgi:hypothetical protein